MSLERVDPGAEALASFIENKIVFFTLAMQNTPDQRNPIEQTLVVIDRHF